MNDQNNEDLLALYYQSRSEQPSELLDQRIRKAAETASRRQQRQWIWGLSRVAVLVLSFSVVLKLWIDQPSIEELGELPGSTDMQISESLTRKDVTDSRKPEMREQSAVAADSVAGVSRAPSSAQKRKSLGQSELLPDSSPATELETFSAELADEAMPAAPMTTFKEPVVYLPIPLLPTTKQELEALGVNVTVKSEQVGILTVYSDGKRILSIIAQDNAVKFKAWQGSGILGVDINWTITPEGLGKCSEQDDYLKCIITGQIFGYFSANHLDHIEWQQAQ